MKWGHVDFVPYQKGYTAGLEGRTPDNCRFTIWRKRNAWFRGYRKGQEKRAKNEAKKANYTRTEQQIEHCSDHCQQLRQLLKH